MNYRTMAEEWVKHIAQQYEGTRISRKDLPLIAHFLKAGFTLIAVRDRSKRLHVDFLGRTSLKPETLIAALPSARGFRRVSQSRVLR